MNASDHRREQALIEARAKITWGEPPLDAVKCLMTHGLTYEEAAPLVEELVRERHATLRQLAVWKVLGGAVLAGIPVVLWFALMQGEARMSMKAFGGSVVGGVYGAWLLINGLITLVAPKSDAGDIADMD